MILGLTGYSSAGKDTVADYLVKEHGFTRLAFADKVRDLAKHLNPSLGYPEMPLSTILENLGWDEAKQIPDVRQYLQTLGTSCREVLGSDVWIQAMAESHAKRIVITDVRFVNEAEWLTDHERAKIIRVTRPGVGPVNDHPSETRMDNYPFDWELNNDNTLATIYNRVDHMIAHWS